jgi:hypothetical protein
LKYENKLYLNRRGIHSKFNLPIPKNNEEQKQPVAGQSNCYGSGGNGGNAGIPGAPELNDLDMSKMKNIEPKLIETIMSEV